MPWSGPSTGRTRPIRPGAWRAISPAPERAQTFSPSDYVWSDQYDWKVQLAGHRARAVAEWVIGTPEAARPQVTVLHADATGRLCAAVCLNWPKAFVQCRRLLDERAPAAQARELLSGS